MNKKTSWRYGMNEKIWQVVDVGDANGPRPTAAMRMENVMRIMGMQHQKIREISWSLV